jgi:hypothetical protein
VMRMRADQAAMGAVNRPLLVRQASCDALGQGDRQGRPYILVSIEHGQSTTGLTQFM